MGGFSHQGRFGPPRDSVGRRRLQSTLLNSYPKATTNVAQCVTFRNVHREAIVTMSSIGQGPFLVCIRDNGKLYVAVLRGVLIPKYM